MLLGQFFYQSVDLSQVLFVQGGENLHSGIGKGQVLAAFQHLTHEVGS